jgi:hypothetical protein
MHYGEEKNLLPLLRIKPWLLGHPAHSLVAILTLLSKILSKHECKKKKKIIVAVKSEISKLGSVYNRIPLQEDGQRKIVIIVSI